MSLARTFLWGGCRCVVASLWPLPDRATPALVADFYTKLIRGVSAGQALQAARNAYRARGGQAKVWAAFQILGDGDTLADRFPLQDIRRSN